MAAPDISKLSAAMRSFSLPPSGAQGFSLRSRATDAPKKMDAIPDPAWFTFPNGEFTVLQLRHPGFGWLAFALPPVTRAHVLTLFLHQALLPKQPATSAASSASTSGGGSLH